MTATPDEHNDRLETAAFVAFMAFQHDVQTQASWGQVPEEMRVTFRMVADAVLLVADRTLPEHDRQLRADTLREAADAMDDAINGSLAAVHPVDARSAPNFLRRRAAALAAPTEPPAGKHQRPPTLAMERAGEAPCKDCWPGAPQQETPSE